jgi:hypothetical protein
MGPPKRDVPLFMTEVTLDQTLGNWYHFIKPIHHSKNLLTVKQLLIVVYYFIVIVVVQTAILKNAFYKVGQGAMEMSLRHEKVWEPLV